MSDLKAAYLGFFCLIAMLIVASGQAQLFWHLWQISADPVSTTGHVTRLDCSNHGHVDYSFEVDGALHGAGNHFIDGINCREVRIGQPVAIYYAKGAPENNYALYPVEAAGNRTRTAFFTGLAFFGAVLLLGPVFLVWLWNLVLRLKTLLTPQ
jgi:hypothetical protein